MRSTPVVNKGLLAGKERLDAPPQANPFAKAERESKPEKQEEIFKLIITFAKLSFANFLKKAQAIKVALTSEPALTYFPDPWPDPYPKRAELVTAVTTLQTAVAEAEDGGKLARDARDNARKEAERILKLAAPYFESVAIKANDITILDATGYDRRHQPVPTEKPLPAPTLKVRRSPNTGEAIADVGHIRGGSNCETQICDGDPAVEANWRLGALSSRHRRIVMAGLTPGVRHNFRSRAIGVGGPGYWSELASIIV